MSQILNRIYLYQKKIPGHIWDIFILKIIYCLSQNSDLSRSPVFLFAKSGISRPVWLQRMKKMEVLGIELCPPLTLNGTLLGNRVIANIMLRWGHTGAGWVLIKGWPREATGTHREKATWQQRLRWECCPYKAMSTTGPPSEARKRHRRILAFQLQRDRGPANTWVWDF